MVHRLLYGRWCAAVLVISLYSVVPSMGGAAGPCDSAITTKDMVMCYDTQYAEAAKRLAELQEQVAGVLSDQAREALTTAQAKWVDFRQTAGVSRLPMKAAAWRHSLSIVAAFR